MLAHTDRPARVVHVEVQLAYGGESADEDANETVDDKGMLGLHPEERLEVERVQLSGEEHGEQKDDRDVVREVCSTFPLERRPICRGELADDSPGLAPDAPRLSEAAPGVFLSRRRG